jgi:hypothetical protein
MSIIAALGPDDFPLLAKGQFVYRRTGSSPFIGPVSMELAADLAGRLNRDHFGADARDRQSESLGAPPRSGAHLSEWARLSSRP